MYDFVRIEKPFEVCKDCFFYLNKKNKSSLIQLNNGEWFTNINKLLNLDNNTHFSLSPIQRSIKPIKPFVKSWDILESKKDTSIFLRVEGYIYKMEIKKKPNYSYKKILSAPAILNDVTYMPLLEIDFFSFFSNNNIKIKCFDQNITIEYPFIKKEINVQCDRYLPIKYFNLQNRFFDFKKLGIVPTHIGIAKVDSKLSIVFKNDNFYLTF